MRAGRGGSSAVASSGVPNGNPVSRWFLPYSWKRMTAVLSALLLCAGLFAPVEAATRRTTKKTVSKTSAKARVTSSKKTSGKSRRGKRSSKAARKPRGQQAISTERVTAIQEALIREKYLHDGPTGVMDAETKAALVKLQREQGWQTKIVPDSRALIKLGLGPDHSDAINADVINKPVLAQDQVPGGSDPQ